MIDIAEVIDTNLSRARKNKILSAIPNSIKPLILGDFEYQNTEYGIILKNRAIALRKVSSGTIQLLLKEYMNRMKQPNIYITHKLPYNSNVPCWKDLWLLKIPALRAIRYKFFHRDIYSKERLHRYGLEASPNCIKCNEIETVRHQIFDCQDVKMYWNYVSLCTGVNIKQYEDLLIVRDVITEIFITCAIKCLIQIDRSKDKPLQYFVSVCKNMLMIESKAAKRNLSNKLLVPTATM